MNIDDLKCCGNCIHFEGSEYEERYNCNNKSKKFGNIHAHYYCNLWEYDSLVRDDRI